MANLPLLALIEVFQNLSVNDLLECRLVNKAFKKLIDNFKFNTLIIYNQQLSGKRWPFPLDGELSYANSFQTFAKTINSEFLFNNFKNIKQLYTENDGDCQNYLECFKCLEKLIIQFPLDNLTLKFENLKLLSLNCSTPKNLHLPNLETLICWKSIDKINLTTISSLRLKHLQCDNLPLNIKQFTNLEYIYTKHTGWIDPDLLAYLPKLSELHLYPKSLEDLNFLQMRIYSEKKREKRDKLKIYLTGVEEASVLIDFGFGLRNYFYLNAKNLACVVRNFNELAFNNPFPFIVNYTQLIHHFQVIPSDFNLKFLNIQKLIVNSLDDHASLIQFIINCKTVHSLKIQKSNSDNLQFYNQLSSCRTISKLTIDELYWRVHEFEFISNLASLNCLKLCSFQLPIALIYCFLSNCSRNLRKQFIFERTYKNAKKSSIAINYENALSEMIINNSTFHCVNIDRIVQIIKEDKDIKSCLIE